MIDLKPMENALKNVYLDVIRNQLNSCVDPVLDKIQQTTSDVYGAEIITINGEHFKLRNCYSAIELTDKAIRCCQYNARATVELLNDEVERSIDFAKQEIKNDFYNEDAEFINKYHTTKKLKFEPPTFEEFLATRTEDTFAHWNCGDISIVMEEENNVKGVNHCSNLIQVDIWENYDKRNAFSYINEYGFDTRKETYYKALEYAQQLFLGDNND